MLLAMQREYRIEPGDTIIAVTDDSGRAKLGQLLQPVARGSVARYVVALLADLSALYDSREPVRRPARLQGSWPISASARTSPDRRREHCDPAMLPSFC